jgi:excisionase family DNA binding protein
MAEQSINPWVQSKEICETFNWSPTYVARLIKTGVLPSRKLLGKRLIPRSAIEALKENNTCPL